MSVFGASFGVGYWVPKSSTGSSHEHLDMGPGLTMVVGLLQHGGFPFYMGLWFFSLLQHYGPIIHGTLVFGCTSRVEDNNFIRGM